MNAAGSIHLCVDNFPAAVMNYHRARSEYHRICNAGLDEQAKTAGKETDLAFLRMLEAPSRNTADLANKIGIFISEYDDCPMDGGRLAIIHRDAQRLAPEHNHHAAHALSEAIAEIEMAAAVVNAIMICMDTLDESMKSGGRPLNVYTEWDASRTLLNVVRDQLSSVDGLVEKAGEVIGGI